MKCMILGTSLSLRPTQSFCPFNSHGFADIDHMQTSLRPHQKTHDTSVDIRRRETIWLGEKMRYGALFWHCFPVWNRADQKYAVRSSVSSGAATLLIGRSSTSYIRSRTPSQRRPVTTILLPGTRRTNSCNQIKMNIVQRSVPFEISTHLLIINVNNPLHVGQTQLPSRLYMGKSFGPVDNSDIRRDCVGTIYKVRDNQGYGLYFAACLSRKSGEPSSPSSESFKPK
jgi:hypothetical protein